MKITKSQLKQIIKEEMTILVAEPMEGGACGDHAEHEMQDVEQMSGSEAFGFAWNKAIEFLRDGGMEEAADTLEALAGPEEVQA